MRRHDDALPETLADGVENVDELSKLVIKIDILFAVTADDEVVAIDQTEALEHVRCLDLRQVMVKNLEHRAAGLDDTIGRKTFAQEVFTRNGAVGQVDVADVVDDLAIDLLGDALVEAAVARLHVKDGDLASLRGQRAETAVRVAQNENGVGFDLGQRLIGASDDEPDRRGGIPSGGVEEHVGLADIEVFEEDLVELVVVVLARVDDHVVDIAVQRGHDA